MNEFDIYINRRGSDCKKYKDCDEDGMAFWIADTDFKVPDFVSNAIIERANHELYGYPYIKKDFKTVTKQWLKRRHNLNIEESQILYAMGVIPALIYAIDEFTNPGDKIIINTPIYPPIVKAIENNGRIVSSTSFIENDSSYSINFDEMKMLASDSKAKMLILVNPHNPIGKVYSKDELIQISNIARDNELLVFSDEIHSDIILSDKKHIPFISIDDYAKMNTITGYNPGKAFNVSGLRTASVIICNDDIKRRFINSMYRKKGEGITIFGQEGYIACYKHGDDYIDQLNLYLKKNLLYIKNYVNTNMPKLKISNPEGTYLLWMDFSEYFSKHEELMQFLDRLKIQLNDGTTFGEEGNLHARFNFAVPRKVIEEGMERLSDGLNSI